MRKAICETYFHKVSIDANPSVSVVHLNSQPEAVMAAIKPVSNDLSKIDLLKQCRHRKIQNTNESFNSKTLKLGVTDAVDCFNEGSIAKANIKPGKFMMNGLKAIDAERRKKADKEVQEENKRGE
ncbi:hypothetical protein PR048_020305 [Dryococelus australis]|uniref:Uncharacterized protein n=1 Tax=Dryococelus australis TaxID=614101 RepID=A0ABQ9H5Z2_9NEOP|nr:hypothetical protein PR048_020305 [Dryococelus australis]